METVEQKNDFEQEKGNLINEKNLLTAQFQDLEVKYQALLNALENQFNDFSNGKIAVRNTVNADFLTFKDKTTKEFSKKIADLREEHKQEIEHLRTVWEDKKKNTNALKVNKERIGGRYLQSCRKQYLFKALKSIINRTIVPP